MRYRREIWGTRRALDEVAIDTALAALSPAAMALLEVEGGAVPLFCPFYVGDPRRHLLAAR